MSFLVPKNYMVEERPWGIVSLLHVLAYVLKVRVKDDDTVRYYSYSNR